MMPDMSENRELLPRMFVFITREEEERKLENMVDALHLPIFYQCRGKGTATSEMLDLFGLSGTTRIITIGILPRFMVPELFFEAEQHIPLRQRGGGIAFTIPITGMQSPVFRMLNEESVPAGMQQMEERKKFEMTEMCEKSRYSMIWVAVANGYSDDVVDAAKSAGAGGGTILKGRRRNSERVSQRLGISMQEGQEFILIVVPKEKKAPVMAAISESCGLKTPAHGMVVSFPIEDVLGIGE